MLKVEGFETRRLFSFYGRYTAFALSLKLMLYQHVVRKRSRKLLNKLLFFPLWRMITLPYFMLVDALGKGVIMTVYAQKI
jgi:hypothetical protein